MRGVVLCLLSLFLTPSHADIKVAVDESFYDALKAIAERYEQVYGEAVTVTPGPATALYRQIQSGADFDVFFSNDVALPRQLIAERLGDADSFMVYAAGELVLWCPRESGPVDLDSIGSAGTVALPSPLNKPYGKAARDLLERTGLWDSLKGRLLLQDDMAAVISSVQSGMASCGFISYEQWLKLPESDRGSLWRAPPRRDTLLKQAAIVIKRSPQLWQGRDFLVFMRSPETHEFVQGLGYRVPGAPLMPAPATRGDELEE